MNTINSYINTCILPDWELIETGVWRHNWAYVNNDNLKEAKNQTSML